MESPNFSPDPTATPNSPFVHRSKTFAAKDVSCDSSPSSSASSGVKDMGSVSPRSPAKSLKRAPRTSFGDSGISLSTAGNGSPDLTLEGSSDPDTNQVFADHEKICQRLERKLGLLHYPRRQENEMDEWKELAAIVGSRFVSASHLHPTFAATVARQNVSPSALLLCMIYIERLHVDSHRFPCDYFMSSSDLFVVSLMTACKFLYDVGEVGDCYNGTWAKEFHIPIKTLNKLEFLFLDALQWNLQSDKRDFDDILHKVEFEITEYGRQFRDFMTYSDLSTLTDPRTGFSCLALWDFVGYVTKMMAVLTASYMVVGMIALSMTTVAPLLLQMTHRNSGQTPSAHPCHPLCSKPSPFPSSNWIFAWINLTASPSAIVCQDPVPSARIRLGHSLGVNLRKKPLQRFVEINRGRFLVSAMGRGGAKVSCPGPCF